ncbi:MAG: right-handed parallel beta-helix repeat-containing protein, partial [Candidatus Cloacimonetes bacterium]|nr:right-handed parallel beta-helix repeat-containing protein [Candidatus Cloacimonadota bacterium]
MMVFKENFMKKITIIFSLLFVFAFSFADTHIPAGNVSGVWTFPNSPYIIDGEISIQQEDQLTIEPGVQVLFSDHYKFNIYGRILAEGTLTDTIIFTAQNTTTGWHSLRFYDTNTNGQDSSKVVYCKLEYGKATGEGNEKYGGAIYCNNSSDILIKNCLFTKNYSHNKGGSISCSNSSPCFKNVTIIDNSAYHKGGGIFCYNSDPSFVNITLTRNLASLNAGGGIFCEESSPSLENVIISENTAGIKGGGICCWSNSNPSLTNVTISGNTATGWAGGGIFFYDNSSVNFNTNERCNIFFNSAPSGTDLFADGNCPIINVIVDTFTVLEPNDYFAYPVDNFTFDILNEKLEPVNEDLYVSPTGSNDNSGLTPEDPLLTIFYALLKIVASSGDPHTIYLTNGTYSPSQTGEIYPLICKNYVFLQGEDQDSTILDGEGLSRILHCPYEFSSIEIENMTIKNGNARNGGGIYCDSYSSPSFINIILSENTASNRGGGIYCNESGGAVSLTNVTICGNTAYKGGGISNGFGYPSSIGLSNVTIKENNATYGGGIYWEGEDLNFDQENRCNIFLNSANVGSDLYALYAYYGIEVIVDTFTVLHPNDYYAFPVNEFTFDILHFKIEQINQDLYVSPTGSDDNSGLSPDEPLLTITHALKIIYTGEANPHTIHLASGIYSPSQTGETFPLYCQSYLSFQGEDENTTILDGEGLSNILYCHYDNNFSIEDMTIQNGNATSYPNLGGGIYCKNSAPNLVNVKLCQNTAFRGGGLYFLHSNPTLIKVTVSGNNANYDGGGIYCDNSNAMLTNVTISENTAGDDGGGISSSWGSSPGLLNCILWNDFPQEIYLGYQSSITVSYSNIQSGWTGIGNIDADPLFADPQSGDFHLTWANFPIPDSTMSPCIDTGDP